MSFRLFCSYYFQAIIHIPSHDAARQDSLSELSPGQVDPVPDGSGEVQVRVRDFVPGPHSEEHSVQCPHSDQPPSTPVPGDSTIYENTKKCMMIVKP